MQGPVAFQSTHSLRSATNVRPEEIKTCIVSIHALLAECDSVLFTTCKIIDVSIHALLAECDLWSNYRWWVNHWFQSTHSLRSATPCSNPDISAISCFNPRTPCGVRHPKGITKKKKARFQSTHSLRSATQGFSDRILLYTVSIHALLAECDREYRLGTRRRTGFNPRTPCGVRLRLTIYIVIQQRKRYFAPTSRRRPSSPSLLF